MYHRPSAATTYGLPGLRIIPRCVDTEESWSQDRGEHARAMNGFPRRFGPYALAKPLARGGMGALYLAVAGEDPAHARTCAIKTVLPHLADKEYLQRFRDEAKVVVQLSHHNLVPVFDSGQVGGEIYLGMDFIDGKDLRGVWNRCAKKGVAFPMDVAVYIVRELARGLEYAHTFGDIKLVHRDVSPPNVLVAFDGTVKLTDFGLASSTLKLEKTAPGIIYGKVSYMSPEQARAEPLDGRTDLYAAGIILWELLTGRQLFPAQPPPQKPGPDGKPPPPPAADELLQRVRSPKILPPSKRATRVPPELDRIALRALASALEDRYPSCAAFEAELSAYLAARYPETDAARVSRFLRELYGDEIALEHEERKGVLEAASKLLGRRDDSPEPGLLGGLTEPLSLRAAEPMLPGRRADVVAGPASPPRADGARALAAAREVRPSEAATPGSADGTSTDAGVTGSGSPPPPPPPARPRASSRGTLVDHPLAGERRREDPRRAAALAAEEDADRAREAGGQGAEAREGDEAGDASGEAEGSSSAVNVIGTIIGGRYRIRRLCGEGGMGRVYEAEHIDIGKRFALKILHPAFTQTPDLVERLRREARAASRIGHPNVVDVTDSGTTPDGAFFFVMEYLEGRELGEIVFREQVLDVRRAVMIAAQVCRALEAAHRAGVIHRDLKPENVLILSRPDQRDFVKVLDFGIARNVTDGEGDGDGDGADDGGGGGDAGQRRSVPRKLTRPGMAMGTPEYMAPEQAAGRPADARSDIYALGAILYEMLGGKPAYEGSNFIEILHKKATEAPPALRTSRPEIPIELEALVLRTLSKDPAVRPQSMAELELALLDVAARLDTGPVDARATDPARQTVDGGPRSRAASYAARLGRISGELRGLVADRRRFTAVTAVAATVVVVVAVGWSRDRPKPAQALTKPESTAAAPRTLAESSSMPAVPAASSAGESAAAPGPVGAAAATPTGGGTPPAVALTAQGPSPFTAAEPPAAGEPPTLVVRARTSGGAGGSPLRTDPKKALFDAEELLRAQRFADARSAFARLSKHRATRARALVALAEIAFQEKNYEQAVQSARLAADRGGGVRARVVLGDAHYRLNRYREAATAYEQALRLDPQNQSARTGLALASKRM